MQIILLIGRVALVAIFVMSGVQKFWDLSTTARLIEAKFAIPAALAGAAAQAEAMTGMTAFQLLAIAVAVVEIAFALLIIFNVGTRVAAIALALYAAAVTFYVHDFWNMAGDARLDNIAHFMKNLSITGALLILFVIGSWQPVAAGEEDYPREQRI